ncbi:MAG: hypothetical protein ACUVXD_08205 [Thermodesulfobacteriota bacterium]
MNIGDRVTFPFANGTKEGVVVRFTDKKAWLRVDFPRHQGKLIVRKTAQIEASPAKKTRRKTKTGP